MRTGPHCRCGRRADARTAPDSGDGQRVGPRGGRGTSSCDGSSRAATWRAAAATTESTLVHLLAAAGLDDDFCWLWPPLVQTAAIAGDVRLATRLLEPVTTASPGIVSAAVAAHYRHLLGLVGALRGDDPGQIEADLRAGVGCACRLRGSRCQRACRGGSGPLAHRARPRRRMPSRTSSTPGRSTRRWVRPAGFARSTRAVSVTLARRGTTPGPGHSTEFGENASARPRVLINYVSSLMGGTDDWG